MRPTSLPSSPEQEFPYGWRSVKRVQPDGSETTERVALTLEDVLHPQEGDVIPESKPHEADRRYLTDVFESRLSSRPGALVTSDLLIHWGVEGMRDHCPDVAVFVGLNRDTDSVGGTLDLPSFGGRCELVVELVSPGTRDNDVVRKREHYHRIGIPLYVIYDQEKENGPRFLRPYRRRADGYAEVETDDKERFDVPLLGLMIGLRDNRAVCYDLRSQEELGDYAKIAREWEEAKRQLEEAARRAEQQEEAYGEQVQARQDAERLAAEAQKEADRQKQEADRQKQEADRQKQEADRQRKAREEIENQKKLADEQAAKLIRDLQEQLRLLQSRAADPSSPT